MHLKERGPILAVEFSTYDSIDWGGIAAYAYRFVEEPIRREKGEGGPPGV